MKPLSNELLHQIIDILFENQTGWTPSSKINETEIKINNIYTNLNIEKKVPKELLQGGHEISIAAMRVKKYIVILKESLENKIIPWSDEFWTLIALYNDRATPSHSTIPNTITIITDNFNRTTFQRQ